MAKVLDMPKLSPTMEEGQISVWHKKEGDNVGVDDLLAEVETDKATMEYRSFDKGTLLKILVPEGSVVRLGQPVAIIGAPGENITSLLGTLGDQEAPTVAATPAARPGRATDEATAKAPDKIAADKVPSGRATPAPHGDMPSRTPEPTTAPSPPTQPSSGKSSPLEPTDTETTGRVKASPYVRKLARERGLTLGGVHGSGPNGRIVARDLEGLEAQPQPKTQMRPSTPSGLAEPEARPLSMMRKAIARRLSESKQTVPHFYLTVDVDADPMSALREQINADLAATAAEGQTAKISFNDLLVKAVAIALVRVPECNAQFTPDAILVHRRVDISVAVAVAEGLVTPVVRDANTKSVLEIAAEVRELASRAKAKKLKPEEMSNGTFSISNLGMYGIDSFSAVINPPEGAILAVGQVRREPVVKGESVVPGRRLTMTLSCDHRVIDGAVGATFLKALRQIVEHPTQILLG